MKIDMDFGITLPDGTRLSSRLWMPDCAETEPVPAILEYLPYRKSDGTIERDDTMHPYFAEHGYACLRVDRRGCGDSEGLYDDEYSETELRDGEAIIAWIADQPWCNGHIGMQGISWGGFNGLQLAARRPDALKAVISIGTTVDRFAGDIHFKGGVQLGENIGWAATAGSWFSMPPDPSIRPNWREMWLNRLASSEFLADRWTRNSDRNDYWKHGSVCESYDQFEAAILVIGGQHDGYRNAMAEMLEHANGMVQGILGPWGHKYPHISHIAPSIDYLSLALRWWDRWLKGEQNGAEDDPAYRVYVMDSVEPDPSLSHRPGKWLTFNSWPSGEIEHSTMPLGRDGLGDRTAFSAVIEPDLFTGRASGEFFPFGFGPGELPGDQSVDDARSLCFDAPALTDEQTLIGAPRLSLTLSSDKPVGQIIARLCDVRPDGRVVLMSHGLLNLRHRDGFDAKSDIEPGEAMHVDVQMDQCAYRIPAGHKLRIAVSGSYWPYCWPERDTFTLTVSGGTLSLPVLTGDAEQIALDPPPAVVRREMEQIVPKQESKIWSDDDQGTRSLRIIGDHGRRKDPETGLITESRVEETWCISQHDPTSAEVLIRWTRALERGNWGVRTEYILRMQGRGDAFVIDEEMRAWDEDRLVFERTRDAEIPR